MIELAEGSYRELAQNVDIIQQLLQTAVEAAQKFKDTAKTSATEMPRTNMKEENV